MKTTKNTTNLVGRKINYKLYGRRGSDILLSLYKEYDSEVVRQEGVAFRMKNGEMFTIPTEATDELATFGIYRRTFNGGALRLELRLN